MRTHYGLNVTPWTTRASVLTSEGEKIPISTKDSFGMFKMELQVVANSKILKDLGISKEYWSIEDCEKYITKNAQLPSKQRGPPLHQILKKSVLKVNEIKEVGYLCLSPKSSCSPFPKNLRSIWKS